MAHSSPSRSAAGVLAPPDPNNTRREESIARASTWSTVGFGPSMALSCGASLPMTPSREGVAHNARGEGVHAHVSSHLVPLGRSLRAPRLVFRQFYPLLEVGAVTVFCPISIVDQVDSFGDLGLGIGTHELAHIGFHGLVRCPARGRGRVWNRGRPRLRLLRGLQIPLGHLIVQKDGECTLDKFVPLEHPNLPWHRHTLVDSCSH